MTKALQIKELKKGIKNETCELEDDKEDKEVK